MGNHNFEWENSVYMAMFNSYVKVPEGIVRYKRLEQIEKDHISSSSIVMVNPLPVILVHGLVKLRNYEITKFRIPCNVGLHR